MRVEQNEQGIYNFDTLVSKPRIAQIGGEKVDVSIIPVAVTLAMAERDDRTKEEILKITKADAKAEMLELFQLMSDVCVQNNPKMTRDFLMKNMNPEKFVVFMQFVMNPMYAKAAKFLESEEGNAATDEAQSDLEGSSEKQLA